MSSSEDDEPTSSKRAMARGLGLNPMTFVTATTTQPNDTVEEEEVRNSTFRKLVLGEDNGEMIPQKETKREASKEATMDKKTEDQYKKYGKNSFALNFMKKFNFTGRVGKSGTGISQPIAVKPRPENMGIGYGNFQEAIHLEENKKIHQEQRGETPADVRRRKRKEQEDIADKEMADLWKKVKSLKTETKKMALSESSSSSEDESDTELVDFFESNPALGDELVYNLKRVVDDCEMKIMGNEIKKQHLLSQLDHEVLEKQSLQGDMKVVEKSVAQAEKYDECLQETLRATSITDFNVAQKTTLMFLHQLASMKSDSILRQAAMLQIANKIFDRWIPDGDTMTDLMKFLTNWMSFLSLHFSTTALNPIVLEIIVPVVELRMTRLYQNDELLDFVQGLGVMIPQDHLQSLVERVIIPRLRVEVETCHPVDMEMVVFPWVPFISRSIKTELHRAIRRKLVKFYKSGKLIFNDRILSQICSWKKVFGTDSFQKLVSDGLLPLLEKEMMRMNTDIDSNIQKEQIDALFAFNHAAIESQVFVDSFRRHLMRKWLRSLHSALSTHELSRVAKWFEKWTCFLAPIHDHEMIAYCLGIGAGAIATVANQEACEFPGWTLIDEITNPVELATRKDSPKKNKKRKLYPEELSTSEFLKEVGEGAGLLFLRDPLGRTTGQGSPLYLLGSHIYIYIDSEIAYASFDDRRTFAPTTLENLLSPFFTLGS